jgi:hypothetical protein
MENGDHYGNQVYSLYKSNFFDTNLLTARAVRRFMTFILIFAGLVTIMLSILHWIKEIYKANFDGEKMDPV